MRTVLVPQRLLAFDETRDLERNARGPPSASLLPVRRRAPDADRRVVRGGRPARAARPHGAAHRSIRRSSTDPPGRDVRAGSLRFAVHGGGTIMDEPETGKIER